MMKVREKVKIPTTKYHMLANIISLVIIAIMMVLLIMSWANLPEKMPTHFNMKGEVDGWGGKGNILVMVFVDVAMYALMCVIERFPQIWNTGVTLTENNRSAVYAELKNMLVTIKLIMVSIFSYAIYVSTTLQGLSFIFAPVVLMATVGTSGFFIVRIYYVAKKYK